MPDKLHDAPGFVTDLNSDAQKQAWSDLISSFMLTDNVSPSLTPQFYDSTKVPETDPSTAKVTWTGFPKQVKLTNPNDQKRWEVADGSRNVQDEYLEWSVLRDASNKIQRIVFCNEGPEYYEFLGETQPDTLLQLYQKLNPGVTINKEDLFTTVNGKSVYNPTNKWNNSTTTGTIMHLIQGANTLGAEVDLGARATVLRKRADGTPITDSNELINCSKYGNPDRNSDPTIGAAINVIARTDAIITIQDPIGLYIDSVNWAQIAPPAGHEDDDPSTFWKWTRGSPGYYMRGEFQVPEGKGYALGDLTVNGTPLQYAGQIADFIKVSITARACAVGLQIPPRFCGDPPPPNDSSTAALSEAEVHHRHHHGHKHFVEHKYHGLAKHRTVRA
jgi:hypothetical protein